jgi:hypothetical protein
MLEDLRALLEFAHAGSIAGAADRLSNRLWPSGTRRDVGGVVDDGCRCLVFPADRFVALQPRFVSGRKKETKHLGTSIAAPASTRRLCNEIYRMQPTLIVATSISIRFRGDSVGLNRTTATPRLNPIRICGVLL